jgi:hypothetical protein
VFPFVTAATEIRVTIRGRTDLHAQWSVLESGLQRIDPSEAGSRATPSASVTFTLPDSWTVSGDLELDAEMTLREGTAPIRLEQPVIARFQSALGLPRPLRIHYVRVCDPDCPPSDIGPQLAQLLPIPDEQLIWERFSDQYTLDPAALLREIGMLRTMSRADLLVVLRREPLFGTPIAVAPGLRLAVASTQGDAAANVITAILRLLGVQKVSRNLGSSDIGSNRFASSLPNATWADLSDVPNTRNYWVASDTFIQLFNSRAPFPAAGPATGQIFLSGTLRGDGSAGTLRPAFRAPFEIAPAAGDGTSTNCVRFFGSGTEPLTSHCFQTLPTQLGLASKPEEEPFALRLSYPEGTRRIGLFKEARELSSLTVSPATPQIEVVAGQTLRWTGTDADGGLLTYRVLVSGDGSNWRPAGLELADTQLVVDFGNLPAGNPLQFQVQASDGVNTAAAIGRLQDPAREAKLDLPVRDVRPPEVLLGRASDLLVPVRNAGTGPLVVTEVKSSSDAVRPVATRLPMEISAGSQGQIQLRAQPAAAGPFASRVTFVANDPAAATATLDVLGNGSAGVAPQAEASPFAVAFGEVAPGQSKELTVTVRNRGNAALIVSSFSVSNSVFAIVSPASGFTAAPGEGQAVVLRFSPPSGGSYSGSLALSTNDPARPVMLVPLNGTGSGGAPPPSGGIEVAPAQLDFGDTPTGQTRQMSFAIANSSVAPVDIRTFAIDNTVFYMPDDRGFTLAPNSQQVVNVRFAPAIPGFQFGVLTITTSDSRRATIAFPLTGVGAAVTPEAPPQVLFSDSFRNRIAGDPCALGSADLSLGGQGTYRYMPLYSPAARFSVGGGALIHSGAGYAGVTFTTRGDPCAASTTATPVGQSATIRADYLLPTGTQAGPFFHTRAWVTGDPLLATVNSGFWVQLHSTGEVKIRRVENGETLAVSRVVTGFDNTRFHTLEASLISGSMTVKLDGVVLSFPSGGSQVSSVVLPTTAGTNAGTAGIGFSSEAGGTASGQQVRDMVVSVPGSGLVIPPNDRSVIEVTPNAVITFDSTRVGSSSTRQISIRNAGLLPLTINSVRFTTNEFVVSTPTLPVTIDPNQTRNLTIAFTPKQSGARLADMSILSNDPRRPETLFTVTGSATVVAGTVVTDELKIDDGSLERAGQVSREVWVMNKLTPPRYPATLKQIRIFVPPDSIPVGYQISILLNRETSNVSGPNEPIQSGSFKTLRRPFFVRGTGRFIDVEIPADETIRLTAGDFYVGFQIGVIELGPIAIDNSSPSQERSWISFDGTTFVGPRAVENLGAGNFMIRAVVELPAQ